MQLNAYIDGFNLYYGCIKDTPYHWLNLLKLCELSFPQHQVHRVRYFTARVRATPTDPGKAQRQDVYLRALRTLPCLSIHYGRFTSHPRVMPLADPPAEGPRVVEVLRTDEKGSDVNLASYLLVDGYEHEYEMAVVVSNDSDLAEPIRLVRGRLHLPVAVLNPQQDGNKVAWELRNAASSYRVIRDGVLGASLFPDILTDAHGTLRRPDGW